MGSKLVRQVPGGCDVQPQHILGLSYLVSDFLPEKKNYYYNTFLVENALRE